MPLPRRCTSENGRYPLFGGDVVSAAPPRGCAFRTRRAGRGHVSSAIPIALLSCEPPSWDVPTAAAFRFTRSSGYRRRPRIEQRQIFRYRVASTTL